MMPALGDAFKRTINNPKSLTAILLAAGITPLIIGLLIFLGWFYTRHPLLWPCGKLLIVASTPIVLLALLFAIFKLSRIAKPTTTVLVLSILVANFPAALVLAIASSSMMPRVDVYLLNDSGDTVIIDSVELEGRKQNGFTLEDGKKHHIILRPKSEGVIYTITLHKENEPPIKRRASTYVTNGFSGERDDLAINNDLELERRR